MTTQHNSTPELDAFIEAKRQLQLRKDALLAEIATIDEMLGTKTLTCNTRRTGIVKLIRELFESSPDRSIRSAEIQELIESKFPGFSAGAVSSTLSQLNRMKFIKKMGIALWRLNSGNTAKKEN